MIVFLSSSITCCSVCPVGAWRLAASTARGWRRSWQGATETDAAVETGAATTSTGWWHTLHCLTAAAAWPVSVADFNFRLAILFVVYVFNNSQGADRDHACTFQMHIAAGFVTLTEPSPWQGSGDSSVVRVPDSWLKGCGFESLQERRENFLLQGQLCVLTLISVSVPPPQ